jgi:hypothetical protein
MTAALTINARVEWRSVEGWQGIGWHYAEGAGWDLPTDTQSRGKSGVRPALGRTATQATVLAALGAHSYVMLVPDGVVLAS